jgi:hypothetical protein
MRKSAHVVIILIGLLGAGAAGAQQYPIMNMIADRVVQRYKEASCEQLWAHRGKHSDEEKNLLQLLRDDAQMRKAFIDKIAAPVVNEMFECGMVP